ncbi:MAG: carbonic anhydrase family protein [Acidimicrobiia bacterium]
MGDAAHAMHRRRFLGLLGAGAGATVAGAAGVLVGGTAWGESETEPPHFGYEGKVRADRWGSLAPEYETCSIGTSQAPVNLVPADGQPSSSTLELRYAPVAASTLNNGHTLQVVTEEGASVAIDGEAFPLVQFHYHTPSEHTLDGRPYLVEWHFVHQTADAKTAVLGVMVQLGAEHAGYASILAAMPKREGKTKALAAPVDPSALLPSDRAALGYGGSLTTPPCTEAVHWTVLETPIEMSEEQIRTLQNYLGPNARPLQALNGRTIERRSVA